MKNHFFAIVVGAGPAGSTAASVLCEKNGLDVALVDRMTFPRDKSCGDGLGPGVAKCLDRLGIMGEFSALDPVKRVTIAGPSGVEVGGYLPKISGRSAIGYVVPRKKFDQLLFKHAISKGAQDFSGHSCSLIKFDNEKERWTVSLKREYDGERFQLYSKVLIGADGASSKIRRMLGGALNPARTTGVGIRSYCKIANLKNELRLDFVRPLLPAYGWIFPIGNDAANFGIGIDSLTLQRTDKSLQQLLGDYQQLMEERYQTKLLLSDLLSAPLPYAAPFSRLAFGSAALIGDAASMINPLSGEGIFYGMHAGIDCAEALHSAYNGQISVQNALQQFEQSFKVKFTSHFNSNWKMKQRVTSPIWSNLAIKACARDETIMDEFVNVMMGEKKKIGLKTKMKIGLLNFWS